MKRNDGPVSEAAAREKGNFAVSPDAYRTFLICFGLAAVTAAVYLRVGGFPFLNYDDVYIFFSNPYVRNGLAWKSIVWGATTTYYEYWHPLMWWSHMLDCQLFGMNAGPHHLVSLAFHVANTLLVFAVFRRMTGMVWRSAMLAALFGLHPLHVESVAWLAERKDLLSSFFWLLSVWAYAIYVEKSKGAGALPPSPKPRVFHGLSLLFFLLGLLSKPMVVTLPFVLLLLDYWPLNRMPEFGVRSADLKTAKKVETVKGLVWEKWPFFALTALFCFVARASTMSGNNFAPIRAISFSARCANIPITYVRYLWKTVWPCNLAVLYPMPDHWPAWQVAGAILLLLLISWWVLVRAHSARYLTFGWLMYLGILVPTIGIVQTGVQAMADRYMYLPSIGLFAGAVWWVADLSAGWRGRRNILMILPSFLIPVLAVLTWVQVQYWRDNVALWSHCLATGSESVIAHQDLGLALAEAGETGKALEQYQAALRLDPGDPVVNLSCGDAMADAGKPREATNYFIRALQAKPDYVEAHESLGTALLGLGDLDGAAAHFAEAIRLNPARATAYAGMGRTLSAQGKSDEAVQYYSTALNIDPAHGAAHYYLGMEYLKRGSLSEAAASLGEAAKLDPTTPAIHMQLAEVYGRQHETAGAVSEYRAVLRLNPNVPEALNNLAWALATTPDAQIRDGVEAVKLAQRACEQTSWQQTVYVGTLAAAHAEAGDFDKAVQMSEKACEMASAHGEKDLLQANQALLEQFKKQQPHREGN